MGVSYINLALLVKSVSQAVNGVNPIAIYRSIICISYMFILSDVT